MIEKVILDKILEIPQTERPLIIAFCGAADLGKSYLANEISTLLNNRNIASSHLTLDSFLMDRAIRKKKKISGYEIAAHDTYQILSTLENWKKGQQIRFRPYDHQTGTKSSHYSIINPSEVLIIEGIFSMHQRFYHLIDRSFFLYTTADQLKSIKLEADLIKRNYTPEYANKIYEEEFALYKRNIEPFKEKADFKLFLAEKWFYKIEGKSDHMKLIKPTVNLKTEYLEMLKEWGNTKEKMVPFSLAFDVSDFKKFIALNEKFELHPAKGFVCHSTFWLLDEKGKIVGTSNIRHTLTDKLLIENGHIGYGIRPSERRKGYAAKILALSLKEAKKIGIKKALLTCDKDNIGSKKVILKNGGIFRREETVKGKLSLSFWIKIE